MRLPFSALCDLLNKLDQTRTKSMNTGKFEALDARTVVAWFNKHDRLIPRQGLKAVTFLSYLFPERRPDRVFNLRKRRLESMV
jgi:DNA ligase-4